MASSRVNALKVANFHETKREDTVLGVLLTLTFQSIDVSKSKSFDLLTLF